MTRKEYIESVQAPYTGMVIEHISSDAFSFVKKKNNEVHGKAAFFYIDKYPRKLFAYKYKSYGEFLDYGSLTNWK